MLHRPLYRRKAGYSFIRSLSPAAWFRADTGVTVTGLGASTWADQSGNGRDLLQSTDASRPPYLSYSGTKYLYLPGVAGNYASTPDSVPISFAGDFGVAAKISMDDWTPTAAATIVVHATNLSTSFAFSLQISTGGVPILYTSADGTTILTHTATAATGVADGATKWVGATMDVDDGGGNRVVKFYLSDDGDSWTQLGNTVTTAGATSIFDAAGPLTIGMSNTSQQPWAGRAYRARVFASQTLTGTAVADFNPNLDASDGSTSFASSATGETWTVNSSGGLPAQIVGRPSLLFDGTADYLKCNAFTLNQPCCFYIAGKQLSWAEDDRWFDGNAADSVVLYQHTSTPNLGLYAGSVIAGDSPLTLNTYGVVCALFNTTASLIQINNTTSSAKSPGANNPGGFTLGARGNGTLSWGNLQILEVIIFSTAHDATQRARVIQYLAGRHGIAL